MSVHVKILAYLYIAYGVFAMLVGLSVVMATSIGGRLPDTPEGQGFVQGLGSFLAVAVVATGFLGFIAGLGLFYRQQWARVFALLVAALALFSVPVGTALAIYTFWALLINRDVRRSFDEPTTGGPPDRT